MKKSAIALMLAVTAVGAFAAGPDKTPKTIKCAVEGGPVNVAKATKNHMYTDYKGRRYFFCCTGCPDVPEGPGQVCSEGREYSHAEHEEALVLRCA